ncbi:hypothetical protein K8354_13190 [Polaribacter litorisediminis]|uniref:hypothetical protein n=1 Tax=Polaribacter litorisediminis TaxID=1908341 RepID=UPI001CBD9D1E|nr:hypothetical protein [Polaribacter litorisediminis]UAM97268.1 hypothetical protein K8354_13190 [Polaribacter litorisediminis]
MKEEFYKCTLLSDVVLNSSLATEGNMSTLDYIPGSNFLGIVAGKMYSKLKPEEAFDVFHSGLVSFGDATISSNESIGYAMPSSLFMDKLNNEIGTDTSKVYLHHLLNKNNHPLRETDQTRLQLKQQRAGYVFSDGKTLKSIKKNFAIKSAQDRKTRNSKDGAMFGFESLGKGQEFIFSVCFKDDKYMKVVSDSLTGIQRLGKSKNAEFGQVQIQRIANPATISSFKNENYVLVYAQSNLCFNNEFGQSTFEPTEEQLGISSGKINWEKSQVRTYSYSSWNFKRNTTNSQRDCILKGSVFYVENRVLENTSNQVGLHQAEGFGRILYNPEFLKEGVEKPMAGFEFKQEANNALEKSSSELVKDSKTVLGKFLKQQQALKKFDLAISESIQNEIYSNSREIQSLKKISSSQWGGIRAYATKAKDMDALNNQLFNKESGYLTHGVAYEKYWDKNLNNFKNVFDKNKDLGTVFIAKFAAEMAKENKRS